MDILNGSMVETDLHTPLHEEAGEHEIVPTFE